MKFRIQNNLSWLIPLVLSALLVGFQLYSTIEKVHVIEEKQITVTASALEKITSLEYRMTRAEEMCCGERKEFEQYIESGCTK